MERDVSHPVCPHCGFDYVAEGRWGIDVKKVHLLIGNKKFQPAYADGNASPKDVIVDRSDGRRISLDVKGFDGNVEHLEVKRVDFPANSTWEATFGPMEHYDTFCPSCKKEDGDVAVRCARCNKVYSERRWGMCPGCKAKERARVGKVRSSHHPSDVF